jgi:AraC-like DNA-binding protein
MAGTLRRREGDVLSMLWQNMSRMRLLERDPDPIVRSYAVTHPHGTIVVPQPPGWDQLVYASAGVMRVVTPVGLWVVPPQRAVWVPSGLRHRIELTGRTSLRTLYLRAGMATLADQCRAVNVTPLARELVLHAVASAPLYPDDAADLRLVAVLLDQLAALPDAPLQLPMPLDERALSVARMLIDDPSCSLTVDALAVAAAASRRTIERCFLADTGLSVGRWRARHRIIEAIHRLAAGDPVTRVSAEIGYATPSAFSAAFRRELGTTPTRYLTGPAAD